MKNKKPTTIAITRAGGLTPSLYTIEGIMTVDGRSMTFIVHFDLVKEDAHIFRKEIGQIAYIPVVGVPAFKVNDYNSRVIIQWMADNWSRIFQ